LIAGDLARRLVLVRAVTFGYVAAWLVVRGPYLWDLTALPDRRFEPVGLLALLDWRPGRLVAITVAAATLCGAVLAAAGRMLRVSAPAAALGMLVVATLASSFGQVFHTEHLLVVHLLVLAAHAWVADGSPGPDAWHVRWALGMLAAVTAITYVVAGVTKLRMAGTGWVSGEVLRNWVAADNLRKLLLEDPYSSVGGRLAGAGWVWGPIAVATLAVELGAPLVALSARRSLATAASVPTGRAAAAAAWAAPVWVAAAWLFHVGVLGLMAIAFPYHLSGVAYLALLPVERIEGRVHSVLRRRRPYTRTTWRTHC
jgi:hypothetical protein